MLFFCKCSCYEEHTKTANSGKRQAKIFSDKHKFDMVNSHFFNVKKILLVFSICKSQMLTYIICHLFHQVKVDDIPLDTADKDETMKCEIFDLRQNFLDHCTNKNYQFNTLRHAKYSTMMCLYEMYNSSNSNS